MFSIVRTWINSGRGSMFKASALLSLGLICVAVSMALCMPLSGPAARPMEVYFVGLAAGIISLTWVSWSLWGARRANGRFRLATWFCLGATIFMVGSLAGMLALGYGRTTALIDNLVQTSGILTYLATAAALFSLPARKTLGVRRLPWMFDVALVIASISGAGWYFVVAPQAQFAAADPFAIWLTFAYPVANLLSVASVVAAAGLGGPFRSARGLLITGIILNVAGDVLQAIYLQRRVMPPAGLIFSAWIASTLLVGLAALQARYDETPLESGENTRQPGVARAVAPILFLSALVILALWGNSDRPSSPDALGLNLACVIAIVCCLGRMLCLIQDNADLASSLATANETLDSQVRERTSELSAALEELEAQRVFLRSVIDALPSFVLTVASDGRVVLANAAAERTYGPAFLHHPERERLASLILSGLTISGEQEIQCADGQVKTFEILKTPVDGPERQLLVVGSDVTVRKAAEQALITARNAAEEANRVKSEFLSKMSHEVRTPLHGIIGLSELLLSEKLSHAERELASNIRSSAESLQALLIDVLDLANPASQRESRTTSLADFCADLAAPFRARAAAKGLRLRADIQVDAELEFEMDVHRLRQILGHLLSNGVKFTDSGEVELTVHILRKAQEIWTVEFTVRDEGIGIDPSQIDTVFEPFSQTDNTLKRRYGGAGLGLSICKLFVQELGGALRVSSEVGLGTEVVAEIPLRMVQKASAETHTPGPIHLRILIAEDNLVNQMILKRQVERLGCEAVVASNGSEAIDYLKQSVFDLVLMDCQMPGVDGLEATRQLRASGLGVPVVAVTANVMPGDRERCLAAGMDDFLPKPVHLTALSELLRRFSNYRSAA